eukprot:c10229_g1_i2.p1 GENE.c10229_g1_i2~~c10229_g1_i2.p1  ORF type:complete len:257 (+),score=6.76 c10229_g1_i2:22-792(+)
MFNTILFLGIIAMVNAHSRFVCPAPQDPNTGIKTGPCGSQSGDFNTGSQLVLNPGWNTIVMEESIAHKGAPIRLALSREGSDYYEDGILLDHIPHNDDSAPNYGNQATWTPFVFTVFIPDVNCTNCKIQSVNPMTDKLPTYDLDSCFYDPDCTTCTPTQENPNCWSTYHSCARVRITGSQPRLDFAFSQPQSWPYRDLPSANPSTGEPSIYFGDEATEWDTNGNWTMMNVPSEYQQIVGPCAQAALDVIGPVGQRK